MEVGLFLLLGGVAAGAFGSLLGLGGGLLIVPLYNHDEPSLFGFPFFYWYQFAWVPVTSLLIWLVARGQRDEE